jgi:hypothetical protein
MTEPRLITKKQAAAYCGVGLERFERHIRIHVPPIYISNTPRWDRKALDQWLDSQSGLLVQKTDAPEKETEFERYVREKAARGDRVA